MSIVYFAGHLLELLEHIWEFSLNMTKKAYEFLAPQALTVEIGDI